MLNIILGTGWAAAIFFAGLWVLGNKFPDRALITAVVLFVASVALTVWRLVAGGERFRAF